MAYPYRRDPRIGHRLAVMLPAAIAAGMLTLRAGAAEGSSIWQDRFDADVPLVREAWTELRVLIDLDRDRQEIFYNGASVIEKSWSEGLGGGGVRRLEAMDLFGNDASTVFYDDFTLTRLSTIGACCFEDGGCQELPRDDCEAIPGCFAGFDTECAGTPCDLICGDPFIRLFAPVSFDGSTCAEDNRCPLRPSPESQFIVSIPWAQTWTFSVCGAKFDSFMYLDLEGPCLGRFLANDDAPGCGTASAITAFVDPAETPLVYLTLEGRQPEDCGAYTLLVSAPCPPIDRDKNCIVETGGPCFEGDTDPFNIGCNAVRPQEPTFDEVACGEIRCGTVGNFQSPDGPRRDLDWYRLDLAGRSVVTMTAVGEFPEVVIFLAELNAGPGQGEDECTDAGDVIAVNQTDGCGQSAEFSVELEPGLYAPIISTAFADPSEVPCGFDSEYQFTLSCQLV